MAIPPDGQSNGSGGGDPDGGSRNPSNGGEPEQDLVLSIQGVRAREGDQPGEFLVELTTTRGAITAHLHPCEGKVGAVIFLGGAGGGVLGPANEVYVRLGRDLVAAGVSSVRVQYRQPGEFQECVLDALAACSFLKGIGAERVVLVGHSFGGAVAVKAAQLSDLARAVVSLSSQRYGTMDVDQLGMPLLLIHGASDDVLDQQASRDIHERAREPKRLVILEGVGHGLAEAPDEVYALLHEFITEHAGDGEEEEA